MTDGERNELLAEYKRRKALGKLPANLNKPVPSGLRDECVKLFRAGIRPESNHVLEGFFKRNCTGDFKVEVLDMDRDKFRPTVDLLKGKAFQPEDKHYELLSWILGPERLPENEESIIGPKNKPIIKRILSWIKARKKESIMASAAFVVLAIGIWLTYRSWQQCMYWNGSEYQVASCNIEANGRLLYAVDQRKLSRFKKVLRPDTVTEASIGKLWYFKTNHRLELFTDSGMHPVWTNRRLKPLSHYMQIRYLTGDTSVVDNSKSANLTGH